MDNRTSTYNRNLRVDTRQFNDANKQNKFFYIKFGYSKKATKFEKIFHLKFDTTQ